MAFRLGTRNEHSTPDATFTATPKPPRCDGLFLCIQQLRKLRPTHRGRLDSMASCFFTIGQQLGRRSPEIPRIRPSGITLQLTQLESAIAVINSGCWRVTSRESREQGEQGE